jgi:hypothetical protein
MKSLQMMHAAVLPGLGATPRCEPFPAPLATDGEAVVTVTAAALKPSDRWMANGVRYAPTGSATSRSASGPAMRPPSPP